MAWSWSYGASGLEEFRAAVDGLDRRYLEVAYAEGRAAYLPNPYAAPELDVYKYHAELKRAACIPTDVLASAVWEQAEEIALSDNGGWCVWLCPFGCHGVEA